MLFTNYKLRITNEKRIATSELWISENRTVAGQDILAGEADCQEDEDDEDDGVCYVLEEEGQGTHQEIEGEEDISYRIMGESEVEQDMVDMRAVGIKGGFVSENTQSEHPKSIKEGECNDAHGNSRSCMDGNNRATGWGNLIEPPHHDAYKKAQ